MLLDKFQTTVKLLRKLKQKKRKWFSMSGTSLMIHRDCSNFELIPIFRSEDESVPNPLLVQ